MTLSELIKNIDTVNITGSTDIEIKGVDIDSRRVAEDHLFVAMKGTQVDGHTFIGKAWLREQPQYSARTCRQRLPKA